MIAAKRQHEKLVVWLSRIDVTEEAGRNLSTGSMMIKTIWSILLTISFLRQIYDSVIFNIKDIFKFAGVITKTKKRSDSGPALRGESIGSIKNFF